MQFLLPIIISARLRKSPISIFNALVHWVKRFRSSKSSSYWKCAKALKMEIGDFCNRANMLIGERNCLSHFSSAEHLDSDVEMFKRSIIHYPEARLNVSRHIADAFLIIDNYHKIREFFKTQQE